MSEEIDMAKKNEVVEAAPIVDFNVWFVMREKRIPAQHLREIVLADFKARGLSKQETVETYDRALAAYGVRL